MKITYLLSVLLLSLFLFTSCNSEAEAQKGLISEISHEEFQGETVSKADSEWKKQLSEEAYYVLRQEGTERAFSSELLDNKELGIYYCGGCGLPLFSSKTKFKSGTGWPSFYEPLESDRIKYVEDSKYGMTRVEVECPRCGGHLGHVFNDGPEPTGLRYCLNGDALTFEKTSTAE